MLVHRSQYTGSLAKRGQFECQNLRGVMNYKPLEDRKYGIQINNEAYGVWEALLTTEPQVPTSKGQSWMSTFCNMASKWLL